MLDITPTTLLIHIITTSPAKFFLTPYYGLSVDRFVTCVWYFIYFIMFWCVVRAMLLFVFSIKFKKPLAALTSLVPCLYLVTITLLTGNVALNRRKTMRPVKAVIIALITTALTYIPFAGIVFYSLGSAVVYRSFFVKYGYSDYSDKVALSLLTVYSAILLVPLYEKTPMENWNDLDLYRVIWNYSDIVYALKDDDRKARFAEADKLLKQGVPPEEVFKDWEDPFNYERDWVEWKFRKL